MHDRVRIATEIARLMRTLPHDERTGVYADVSALLSEDPLPLLHDEYEKEFDRQVEVIIERLGKYAHHGEDALRRMLEELRPGIFTIGEVPMGRIPFVICIPTSIIPLKSQIALATFERAGKGPTCILDNGNGERNSMSHIYNTSVLANIPRPYLLCDVEMGNVTLGKRYDDARQLIDTCRRRTLHINELMAISWVYPRTEMPGLTLFPNENVTEAGTQMRMCVAYEFTAVWSRLLYVRLSSDNCLNQGVPSCTSRWFHEPTF